LLIAEPFPKPREIVETGHERFKLRTEVGRANSILKDRILPVKFYVKGLSNVSFVLFAALTCLAALRTFQYFVL
jgi:hypothetical protein